jgi:TetR/AcrR family transcriptional repressor of mexJK operon
MATPRADDPRVVRSRAAVVEAATTLFLEKGFGGTTMEEIAALAGITKRTVYNNYTDKGTLFTQIVADTIAYAGEFARDLHDELAKAPTATDLPAALHDLARRLALAILRPEIIALRRLLIREARTVPGLAKDYFDRAPGRVIAALAAEFENLSRLGLLHAPSSRRAAEQFAYLVVGEPLDRAMLVGTLPSKEHALECAREGVETFLARYGTTRGRRRTR